MSVARIIGFALAPLALGLAGCGPVPVAQAEQSCLRDARLAKAPRGEVALGVGTGPRGTTRSGRVTLEIGSDYVMRRDPAQVFDRCVLNRSGQMPSRPLSDQPGWRG